MTLQIVPANQAACSDLLDLFGDRGLAATCQCQRYRLAPGESFSNTLPEELAVRLHQQTACGEAAASETTGLLAYREDQAVGWCAVAPRSSYRGLVRNSNQTAWRGRDESRDDPAVWAVTCIFIRPGQRGQGIARALASASIDHARTHGAGRLEAYPIITRGAVGAEDHPGPLSAFLEAGFEVIHQPSARRAVVAVLF